MKTGISIKKIISLLTVLILVSGITVYAATNDDESGNIKNSEEINISTNTDNNSAPEAKDLAHAEKSADKSGYSAAGTLIALGYTKYIADAPLAENTAATGDVSVTDEIVTEAPSAQVTEAIEDVQYEDASQYTEYYEEEAVPAEYYEESYTYEETYCDDTSSYEEQYTDNSYEEEQSTDTAYVEPAQEDITSPSLTYLGNFMLTAYCACPLCCGSYSNGYTASGTLATEGVTVAMGDVDFGTQLVINGHTYTVEDRGTSYGHVDIFFSSHEAALQFGLQYADVYVLN